jgi:hypothetical protein
VNNNDNDDEGPIRPIEPSDPVMDPSPTAEADTQLDTYHQALIQRVLDKDSDNARAELACELHAQLQDEIHELESARDQLGEEQQIAGIKRTGWAPWYRVFLIASLIIAGIDCAAWYWGGTRLFTTGTTSKAHESQGEVTYVDPTDANRTPGRAGE